MRFDEMIAAHFSDMCSNFALPPLFLWSNLRLSYQDKGEGEKSHTYAVSSLFIWY